MSKYGNEEDDKEFVRVVASLLYAYGRHFENVSTLDDETVKRRQRKFESVPYFIHKQYMDLAKECIESIK